MSEHLYDYLPDDIKEMNATEAQAEQERIDAEYKSVVGQARELILRDSFCKLRLIEIEQLRLAEVAGSTEGSEDLPTYSMKITHMKSSDLVAEESGRVGGHVHIYCDSCNEHQTFDANLPKAAIQESLRAKGWTLTLALDSRSKDTVICDRCSGTREHVPTPLQRLFMESLAPGHLPAPSAPTTIICDVCKQEHDASMKYGGMTIIACPEVPEGWIVPSSADLAKMFGLQDHQRRQPASVCPNCSALNTANKNFCQACDHDLCDPSQPLDTPNIAASPAEIYVRDELSQPLDTKNARIGNFSATSDSWTCSNHLTPISDIPEGEKCSVCGASK